MRSLLHMPLAQSRLGPSGGCAVIDWQVQITTTAFQAATDTRRQLDG
jgi:hypothetical protein